MHFAPGTLSTLKDGENNKLVSHPLEDMSSELGCSLKKQGQYA